MLREKNQANGLRDSRTLNTFLFGGRGSVNKKGDKETRVVANTGEKWCSGAELSRNTLGKQSPES